MLDLRTVDAHIRDKTVNYLEHAQSCNHNIPRQRIALDPEMQESKTKMTYG